MNNYSLECYPERSFSKNNNQQSGMLMGVALRNENNILIKFQIKTLRNLIGKLEPTAGRRKHQIMNALSQLFLTYQVIFHKLELSIFFSSSSSEGRIPQMVEPIWVIPFQS